MARYTAFLRGINVGGRRLVSMEKLKKVFESLRFQNVRTLLASGNVMFEGPAGPGALEKRIQKKLKSAFGVEIGTQLRTIGELENLAATEPFKGIRVKPNVRLFVTFLAEKPRFKFSVPYVSPDGSFRVLRLTQREVISVLTLGPQWARNLRQMDILEKELGKKITTRSWNTIVRILKASA